MGLSFREELLSMAYDASCEEERIMCLVSEFIWVVESVSFVDASESTMRDASGEEEIIKSICVLESVSFVDASDSILFVESVSLVDEE